jgi:hypothetical protein
VDADEALDRLLAVSEEVHAAVVFERSGEAIAATVPGDDAADIAGLGDAMLVYADSLRPSAQVRRVQAVTPEGDVYVVRDDERAVVAVARPGSLAGLVLHDLRTLLRSLSRQRRRRVVRAT